MKKMLHKKMNQKSLFFMAINHSKSGQWVRQMMIKIRQ